MRFQVPQFIDVEDKIFGPLTLKQFIYLAGGGGLSFVLYSLINNLLWSAIPIIIVISISCVFAFYKLYNKFPFINVAEAAFKYYVGNKLYIWKKKENVKPQTVEKAVADVKSYASIMVPKISDSKLKDLTWSLDIKESVYSDKNQK